MPQNLNKVEIYNLNLSKILFVSHSVFLIEFINTSVSSYILLLSCVK